MNLLIKHGIFRKKRNNVFFCLCGVCKVRDVVASDTKHYVLLTHCLMFSRLKYTTAMLCQSRTNKEKTQLEVKIVEARLA